MKPKKNSRAQRSRWVSPNMTRGKRLNQKIAVLMTVLMLLAMVPVAPLAAAEGDPLTVSISTAAGIQGENVTVDINLSNVAGYVYEGLSAANLVVNYDAVNLTLQSVNKGAAVPAEANFNYNETSPGVINLTESAANDSNLITGDGVFAQLIFTIKPGTPNGNYPIIFSNVEGDNAFTDAHTPGEAVVGFNLLGGGVNVVHPSLQITADKNELEVNLRDKLTLQLLDPAGNPYTTPSDVVCSLQTNSCGSFYPQAADVLPITTITIPLGSSSAEVYYRPEQVGAHEINISSTSYTPAVSAAAPLNINATPAAAVNDGLYMYAVDNYSAQIVAGKAMLVKVEAWLTDQYGNQVAHNAPLTVTLDVQTNDNSAAPSWQLLAADSENQLTETAINSVELPVGKNDAYFYFRDTRATTTSYYQPNIVAKFAGREFPLSVIIKPAATTKVVVAPANADNVTCLVYESMPIRVSLQDQYGNIAETQPPALTTVLSSSSPTGKFLYGDSGQEFNQLSFPAALGSVTRTTPLQIKNKYSSVESVTDPWESPNGKRILSVYVDLNSDGYYNNQNSTGYNTFYLYGWNGSSWIQVMPNYIYGNWNSNTSLYNFNTWIDVSYYNFTKIKLGMRLTSSTHSNDNSISVPEVLTEGFGNSHQIVYQDSTPGTHTITATADYTDLQTVSANLTFLPLPAQIVLTPEKSSWLINHRGKVTVSLKDTNGADFEVPEAMSEGLNIGLNHDRNGHFWSQLLGGIPCYNVVIPAGASSADFYFLPLVGGTHHLNAFIGGHDEIPDGQLAVNISKVSPVKLGFGVPPVLKAGQVQQIDINVLNQYNVNVAPGENLILNLSAKKNGQIVETAKFYTDPDKVGDAAYAVTTIELQPDQDMTSVYFQDTKTNSGIEIGVTNRALDSAFGIVQIVPGDPQKLIMEVKDLNDYNLNVAVNNGNSVYDTSINVPWHANKLDKLVTGQAYSVKIGLADAYDNPGALSSSPLMVDLLTNNPFGKFYQYADANGNNLSNRITQIPLDGSNGFSRQIWFKAGDPGSEAAITGNADGLTQANYSINVVEGDSLVFYFQNSQGYYGSDWHQSEGQAQKDSRIPVVVGLMNASSKNPAQAGTDVTINLEGASFYNSSCCDESTPIQQIVLPAGYSGVMVYMDTGTAAGPVTVTAKSSPLADANGTVYLGSRPYYGKWLARGWNTLSTPIALAAGKDNLDAIISEPEKIDIPYVWKDGSFKQLYRVQKGVWRILMDPAKGEDPNDPIFHLQPLDAIYIKMKASSCASFWASTSPTVAPIRPLNSGWNLIGPNIDVNIEREIEPSNMYFNNIMFAGEALNSIKGNYSQAVSPGLGEQVAWAFIPKDNGFIDEILGIIDEIYGIPGLHLRRAVMQAGCGYWVYLQEPDELAGFCGTPISNPSHSMYE